MKHRNDGRIGVLGSLGVVLFAVGCASAGGTTTDVRDGGGVLTDGGPAGACTNVGDCSSGQGCLSGRCTPVGAYECRFDLAPIVQIEPSVLDFGSVRVNSRVDKTLRVRNIGSCNLLLNEVSLDPTTSREFTCDECRPRGTYPVTLVPFDSKLVVVSYTATDAMPDMGSLSVVSNDAQFPLVRVPLKSSTKDAPKIFVDPGVLDFGYVPVGQVKTLPFNITNVGGMTPLEVRSIENLPLASPNYTLSIPPPDDGGAIAFINAGDPPVRVDVTYRPPDLNTHNEAVRVVSTDPQTPRLDVQVKGFSVTPPSIRVNPTLVTFGNVPVGSRQSAPVTIENNGGAPLNLQLAYAPLSSTAFSFNPSGLPPIPGGQRATLYMDFFPAATGAVQAILNVGHNATNVMSPVAINLTGAGVPSTGDDVLALELTFENGDDNFWGSDLRDVNLHYRTMNFQDCSKQTPSATWGNLGQCQWIGIGPRQEPERIVHTNAGMREAAESYIVELEYAEDCETLPTTLITALTGLALDVVLAYLAGGIVPAGAGTTIANAILSNCLNRSSSNAQVKAYVNGTLVTSRTVRMRSRGELLTVFNVERRNGRFTVR
jgi:hypothetical protein